MESFVPGHNKDVTYGCIWSTFEGMEAMQAAYGSQAVSV